MVDSLTKRLLLRSGMLNTPPLFNTGLVYTDEPLKDSEIKLHNAKKALKHLENGLKQHLNQKEVSRRTTAVNKAIRSLRPSEQPYFRRRYIENDVILRRAMGSQRLSASGEAAERARERARALQEAEKKMKAKLEEARIKKEKEEKAFEEEQARLLAEQEKNAKDADAAAQAAAQAALAKLKAQEDERIKNRDLLRQQAEKRQKAYLKAVQETAEAAEKAKEALEANLLNERDLAEKERQDRLAKEEQERLAEEAKRSQAILAQIQGDMQLAKELEREELKRRLDRIKEQQKQQEEEAENKKEEAKQIAKDLALALQLRDDEFARAREAEAELEKKQEEEARAGEAFDWHHRRGWQKDWIQLSVTGDGNCLFHAVCLAMGRDEPNCHTDLRTRAMQFVENNLNHVMQPDHRMTWRMAIEASGLDNIISPRTGQRPTNAQEYIEIMKQPGTWATNYETAAIFELEKTPQNPVPVNLVQEYPGGMIVSPPRLDGSPHDVHVYHITPGAHYTAVVHRSRLSERMYAGVRRIPWKKP
ncbi:unnamed protein product [Ectocarpus sp. 13 AM-2016]